MSEEEIIKKANIYKRMVESEPSRNGFDEILIGLLNLYNKEKETSHYIQSQLDIANAKLIELENADLTTVYMNGFYDGEKKWKDKIKKIIYPTPTNAIPIEIQASEL